METDNNTFFKKLTKLFSTQSVVRTDSSGKRNVVDLEGRQQGTTNVSYLRDKYTKLQRSYYADQMSAQSMAYHSVRRELFRDYDAMDNDAIISSALDIYADECLSGETKIPLLNGDVKTIQELYEHGYSNFWIYGSDSDMNFKPVQALKVSYNGRKNVKKIIFDDGTEIKCTDNHIWILPNGEEVTTSELKEGDSIFTLNINEFITTYNHKIISIADAGICDVYDLVNTGDNHRYAILSNDGSLLYTHNCTLKNEFGEVVQIRSQNSKIKEILENLFYDILNIDFNLWPWTRNMVKYGDFYLFLEIQEKIGIVNVQPLPLYETERIENTDPDNPNYVKFKVNNDPIGKGEYENYEVAHFRLLSDTNFLPYGKSMIEGGRRIWKQISLMEDAMLIHRIMRAPEKRIFKIDIGNISPTEVDNYMQKIINKMKKTPFVDKRTGDYNLKYNIQNITEDFYLPVRGSDSGTNIESLGGLEYSSVEDIDYLKAKMFAALKIPKAYLGYDEGVNGKATIAAEDVRFARTIERIQRTLISELTKLAIVHLAAQGVDGIDLVDFELSLVNPSTIYEQEKIALWAEKVRLISDMKDLKMVSKDWQYKNILNMSDDEIDEQKVKIINDLKDTFRFNEIEQQGNDPADTTERVDVEGEIGEIKEKLKTTGKVGRPKEPSTYGTDRHPYGRDPLGNKENEKAFSLPKVSDKWQGKRLAREYKDRSNKHRILKEKLDFLDDTNIIDD